MAQREAGTAINGNKSSLEVASSYLLDFFATGGRSVLIRGDPGTGKTSLVLQLLDYHSKVDFKSIYMSTRLSAKTLKSHQPWVDVVQGKYGTVPRLEGDQIGFQDSRRMDGVRAISGLRQYLEQVTNPFVVLDSWEGLFFESHTMGVEEISKLVEDYDARFVVVTERREQTDLDYLLDGVVVLRRKYHEQRVVREIELKKLRGVSIQQSRFLFTLESGKFRYLPPFSPSSKVVGSVGEPITSSLVGTFSTGNRELDSMIGNGLKSGSLNLVEVGEDVPFEITSLLLRLVLSNFINNGHRVMYVPFLGSPRSQLESILPNLSNETIQRSVSVTEYEGIVSQNGASLEANVRKDFEQIQKQINSLRKESNKPVLLIISEDSIEGLYGASVLSNELVSSIALGKSSGNVILQISSPSSSLLPELKALCDTNVRIEMIHGTPVIFSVKPASVMHAIFLEPVSSGKTNLVPIV